MNSRLEQIEGRLREALLPERLEIIDESQAHAGHAGASQHGGGHYFATIVSEKFDGKSLVQRHQLVYQALGELMETDIHAFSMKAFCPDELKEPLIKS